MSMLLRFSGIVFVILVATLVVLSCGVGECGSCVHAYCVRSKPTARIRGVLARFTAACSASAVGVGGVAFGPPMRLVRSAVPRPGPEVSPLRI